MIFIFSTGSLYNYGLERAFDLAARAGFEGIEILIDHRWDTRQPDFLRRLVDRYRLPIVAVHSPFVTGVPGWPADEPGRVRESVQLAESLQAEVVILHLPRKTGKISVRAGAKSFSLPFFGRDEQAAYRRWLEDEYPAFQESTPVAVCLENMPARRWLGRSWNNYHWNNPAEIVRFPYLTLDTTHLGTWGLDPADFYPNLQGQVRHVHLSNFDGREHRRPEDGQLRLDRFLAGLSADDYQGAVSLETAPAALDAGKSDEHLLSLLSASLTQCRKWSTQPDS